MNACERPFHIMTWLREFSLPPDHASEAMFVQADVRLYTTLDLICLYPIRRCVFFCSSVSLSCLLPNRPKLGSSLCQK